MDRKAGRRKSQLATTRVSRHDAISMTCEALVAHPPPPSAGVIQVDAALAMLTPLRVATVLLVVAAQEVNPVTIR